MIVRLVKIDDVWVNPAQVTCIVPYSGGTSRIKFSGQDSGLICHYTVDKVADLLREKIYVPPNP